MWTKAGLEPDRQEAPGQDAPLAPPVADTGDLTVAAAADPDALRAALSPREVSYLRAWRELLDPEHRAWRRLDGREVGIDALVAMVSNL